MANYTVIADVTSAPSNTRLSLKVIEQFYFHAEASGALDNENGAYLIEAVKIQALNDYVSLIVNLISLTNEKEGTVCFISELCLFHHKVGKRWTRLPHTASHFREATAKKDRWPDSPTTLCSSSNPAGMRSSSKR